MCDECEARGLSPEEAVAAHRRKTSQLSLDEITEAVLEAQGPNMYPTRRFSEAEMEELAQALDAQAKRSRPERDP